MSEHIHVETSPSGENNVWDGREWIYGVSDDLAAVVRTGVVAEEPEWEYGVGWNYVGATVPMGTRYPSRESAEDIIRRYPQDQDFGPNYLVRRTLERPAGPWVPVKQEGAEQ